MAEVIGVVVSGISIAQLSGQILSNGLKIKALVNDIQDAPETIEILLDELQILAQVFNELDSSQDVSFPTTPSLPLRASLHKATLQCRKAADQLSALAHDLSVQIESHRSMRRRIGRVRVVLKRDTLAKYERRLQSAVTLLSLTQQSYILYVTACNVVFLAVRCNTNDSSSWQRSQPHIVAEEVIRCLRQEALNDPRDEANDQDGRIQEMVSSDRSYRAKRLVHDGTSDTQSHRGFRKRTLKFGRAYITGVLEVIRTTSLTSYRERNKVNSHHHALPDQGGFSLGIKGRCPLWLTSWAFDSILDYSQRGWTHSLRVYRVHPIYSNEWKRIGSALEQDSVPAVRELIQTGAFHPRDRVYWDPVGMGMETSFLMVSMRNKGAKEHITDNPELQMAISENSWAVGNYLLEHGAEPHALWRVSGTTWKADNESTTEMLRLLEQDGISDVLRIVVLGFLKDTVGAFNRVRKRMWSDDEFFHDSFRESRFSLAFHFLQKGGDIDAPAIFRSILSPTGELRRQDLYAKSPYNQIINLLASALGNFVWQDPIQDSWATMAGNIVRLLEGDWLRSGDHPSVGSDKRWLTPLEWLLKPSLQFFSWEHYRDQRKCRLRNRLLHCERALKSWLTVLASAGVDLLQYGEWEASYAGYGSVVTDRKFEFVVDTGYDAEYDQGCNNSQMTLRLLWFRYGEQIDSWKLIWSEPTDELVGNFWRAIEADTPISIPGAWVEDSEES